MYLPTSHLLITKATRVSLQQGALVDGFTQPRSTPSRYETEHPVFVLAGCTDLKPSPLQHPCWSVQSAPQPTSTNWSEDHSTHNNWHILQNGQNKERPRRRSWETVKRLKEIKETSHLNIVCGPALNPGQEKRKEQGGKEGRQEKGREEEGWKKEGVGGEKQTAIRIWGQLNKFEYEHRI